MLGIAPAFLIRGDIRRCNVHERGSGHLSGLSRRKRLCGLPVPFLQRINARLDLEAQRSRFVARIGKRQAALSSRAKANVPRLAV